MTWPQSKQNVRAACPKGKLELKIFSSHVTVLSLEYQSSLCYPREQWGCRLLYVPRIGRDREGVTKSVSICSILPVCWRIGVEIFEIKVNVLGMTIPKISGTYQWRIFLKKKQSNRAVDWIKFNENQYMYKVIKKERKYLY